MERSLRSSTHKKHDFEKSPERKNREKGPEIVSKGPGLYSNIGRKTRDLLYKDYQTDQKVTLTTYSWLGVTLTSSGTKKEELFLTDINALLKHKNITTDVKVRSNSKLLTTITVNEPSLGLKTILSFEVPEPRSGKLELQYLHDYAGITSSFELTPNPVVNFSGVLGNNKLAVGGELSFDTKDSTLTKYNIGLSSKSSDLIASVTLNDKFDTFNASYYVSLLTNHFVGVELTRSFSSNKETITIGTHHLLNPLTSVKVRVNNFGKVSGLIQHKLRPRSLFTVSTEVDTKSIDKIPKFGLALALKP